MIAHKLGSRESRLGKSSRSGRLSRAVVRRWLALRYRLLDRRYGRLVLETIDEVPLIVLPKVFNPVLLRTGEFMVRSLDRLALKEGAAVLDLGTGSGVGAIFAALRGARVVAVDINPDAVRNVRVNVLLNRVEERVEIMQGNLFEPVAGRRFDLILFNPPFHRGRPEEALDHAWRGEAVFERFAGGLPDALQPGGRALLVLSSDGDGDQLLRLLDQHGFQIAPLTKKNFINELLTAYEIAR